MKSSEVFVAQRDPDEPSDVTVEAAPVEFEGLRADQILTSPAFGLVTTRSGSVASDVERYSALISKRTKTDDDLRDLRILDAKLDPILTRGETAFERRVEVEVRRKLEELTDPAALVQLLHDHAASPQQTAERVERPSIREPGDVSA
jgi:hypothetical protein